MEELIPIREIQKVTFISLLPFEIKRKVVDTFDVMLWGITPFVAKNINPTTAELSIENMFSYN